MKTVNCSWAQVEQFISDIELKKIIIKLFVENYLGYDDIIDPEELSPQYDW
jgi:hypothetical protein